MVLWPVAVLGQRRPDGVSGRVVLPVALGHRPPHHRPDPLANPTRRHPLLVPDGKQHRHHVRRVDPVHRPPAELRQRVVPEACPPELLLPAAVLPAGPVQPRSPSRRPPRRWGLSRFRPVTSSPRRRAARFRAHFSRASARLTWGQDPSPRLRWRPSTLMRCAQDLATCPRVVCLTRSERPPEPRPSP